MTGRNHHSVGVGSVMEFWTEYPGYNSRLKPSAGTLPEILGEHGYSRYAVGKWHLTPVNESSAAGPFERWPLGKGFERFYGFLMGETDQFHPWLTYDNHFVEAPKSAEEGYHFSEDIIDKAIHFVTDLKAVQPERPFFLYTSFGACHAPHQAPQAYLDKYRGYFDKGWDQWREDTLARQKAMDLVPENTQLPPRNMGVKAWESLKEDEKRLYCRFQEAFAAMLDHTDAQIGRLMDYLEEIGEFDNTLFILVSDNGASQEGGPNGAINEFSIFNGMFNTLEENMPLIDTIGGPNASPNYPWGWSMAGNTPLKRYKQNTHYGGIRDPFIVSWTNGITARGEIRHQFHHATDVLPTILELLELDAPDKIKGVEQQPIEGISMAYSLADGNIPTRKEVQYFEMFGHRGIWHDGWKAVTWHFPDSGANFERDKWELYHVAEDISECNDLAQAMPEKLQEMIDLWWQEAEKYNVLPLDDRLLSRFNAPRPPSRKGTKLYTYYPGSSPVPEQLAVRAKRRSYVITAHVEIPAGGAEGVIISQGGQFGGWAFFMKEGRLAFAENVLGLYKSVIISDDVVPAGACTLRYVFKRNRPNDGTGELYINERKIGEGEIPKRTPVVYSISEGLNCGRSGHTPVSDLYTCPFPFTGTLEKVTIDVNRTRVKDLQEQLHAALAMQ